MGVFRVLRQRRGYALLAVLCVLLVFTVLGHNALMAAYASFGTVSKKQDDSQAALLASSAAVCMGKIVPRGDFNSAVKAQLLDPTLVDPTQLHQLVTQADLALPSPVHREAAITLTMELEDPQVRTAGGVSYVEAMLVVVVTAVYQDSTSGAVAVFSQAPSGDPRLPGWRLQEYRNIRV